MTKKVIELASGKLASGTNEAEFIKAAEAVQESFLSKQPGYISRDFFKGEDGVWGDMVHWDSLAEAEQASKAAMESSVCGSYFSMFNQESISMQYMEVIHSW